MSFMAERTTKYFGRSNGMPVIKHPSKEVAVFKMISALIIQKVSAFGETIYLQIDTLGSSYRNTISGY